MNKPYPHTAVSDTVTSETVAQDVNTLIRDAQTLFHSAAALTGEKADEIRNRGLQALDKAVIAAHHAQDSAVAAGKKAAASTDAYVKEHPWQAVAAAASIGVLAGALLLRR